jgi:hypothetical protein
MVMDEPTHDDKCERCGECLGCAMALVLDGRKKRSWCIVRDDPRRQHRWPPATDAESLP